MTEVSFEMEEPEAKDLVVHLRHRLDRTQAGVLWRRVGQRVETAHPRRVVLDFHKVSGIDSAGVALVRSIERLCADRGISCEMENAGEGVAEFLEYARAQSTGERPAVPAAPGPVSGIGEALLGQLSEIGDLIRFLGDVTASLGGQLVQLRKLRLWEVAYQVQRVGAGAMPLVASLSFLMGVMMAFQGLSTVRNFGSPVLIADIVTVSTAREMAPLLTAVIIAGRSGAAFAAEIGTMKINEEIDALTVMGFDIARFLVLPRLFALAFAGPFLTLLADVMGMLAGACVGVVVLNLSFLEYFSEVNKVLSPGDLYTGVIKGFGFASLVAFIGCFQGLQTGVAAEDVGRRTTSAVVSGILLIIVADTVFSVLFHLYQL